jgi:Na(+)/H(+) antiporter nhaA
VVHGISLAIICGLVIGKFVGIFGFSWITVKLGLAPIPQHCNWKMMASISVLGGIGFTVSLFIANLSFASMGAHGAELLNQSKLGIVVGSLAAGIIGFMLLHCTLPSKKEAAKYLKEDEEKEKEHR